MFFSEKSLRLYFILAKYFLHKTWVFLAQKYFRNASHFGGSFSSALSCVQEIISRHFLGEEKYRSKGKKFKGYQMQTLFKSICIDA